VAVDVWLRAGLLVHLVADEGRRPALPAGTQEEWQQLLEACWADDPQARPTFVGALAMLRPLRASVAAWEDT
jgi:hypothetical protein